MKTDASHLITEVVKRSFKEGVLEPKKDRNGILIKTPSNTQRVENIGIIKKTQNNNTLI